jgi:hypothetical protein
MAEAASRRPLIAERSGFDLESVPVRLVVDVVALGRVLLLRLLQFYTVLPPICQYKRAKPGNPSTMRGTYGVLEGVALAVCQ